MEEVAEEKAIEKEKKYIEISGEEKDLNSITIGDFRVASTTEKLSEVEATINRLIERHKDFAEMRRKKVIGEGHGMFS